MEEFLKKCPLDVADIVFCQIRDLHVECAQDSLHLDLVSDREAGC